MVNWPTGRSTHPGVFQNRHDEAKRRGYQGDADQQRVLDQSCYVQQLADDRRQDKRARQTQAGPFRALPAKVLDIDF
jgi:hypothetical protein